MAEAVTLDDKNILVQSSNVKTGIYSLFLVGESTGGAKGIHELKFVVT